jgi:hypothetical protein
MSYHLSFFSSTTMAPSPPPSKTARELRAVNRSAGVLAVPAPKPKSTSRKRQQSNADESVSKRNKTATNEGDDADDVAIDMEEAIDGQKSGKKGRKTKKTGGKAKKMYLFYFIHAFSILTPPPLLVERHLLTVKMKMTLRMPKAHLPASSRVYSNSLQIFFPL